MLPNMNPARGLSAIRSILRQAKLDLNFARDEVLDPRITFSRTSNATRTNAQGLIEYAPYNLLTYSENFDNAVWAKSNATVTANAVISPDGTTTGDTVLAVATGGDTGVRYTTTQTSGTVYTASIYAKYTNTRYLVIRNLAIGATLGDQWTFFDLLNGTVGTKPASVTAVITPVGGGWYRCSVSATTLATIINNFLDYRLSTTDNAYSVLNTSTINIWGAQLNIGSLQPYYTTSVKNLLGYTQNFENAAWTKSNSSVDATPVMGPLGFLGAEKLVENTVNTIHYTYQGATTSANTSHTLSVYCKAAERTQVDVRVGGLGWAVPASTVINLSNGSVISGSGTVVSVGSGWYRISITGVTDGTIVSRGILIAPASGGTATYTGDGTSGIYIFGAQLSDSASLDSYSYNFGAAPTSTAYYGPRFDYDPVTLAPKGLLIEEARTNLITYSQNISTTNGYQIDATSNLIANSVVAPDGTLTASKFEAKAGGSTDQYYYRTASGLTVGATYTYSAYLKLGLGGNGRIRLSLFSSNCIFDLNTGTIITGAGTIISVGNGWYRCSISNIATLTSDNYATADIGTFNAGQGHIVWGAQLEQGAFATSYIPTTSAQVTRAADNASMVGTNFSSWYNQSEGTVACESLVTEVRTSDYTYWRMNDDTSINRIQAGTGASVTVGNAFIIANNVSQGTNIVNVTPVNAIKTAFAIAANNTVNSANGVIGAVDTTVLIPTVNQLMLGRDLTSGYINGHIQSFKYFNKRLLNTYLQRLTQ